MDRDTVTLLDILSAARLALKFIEGVSELHFMADEKTQAAVIREVEIIGEAAKRLSPQFREKHDEIPWRQIVGMRDVLIHAYDSVDLEELWYVTQVSIPELIRFVEPLVPEEDEGELT